MKAACGLAWCQLTLATSSPRPLAETLDEQSARPSVLLAGVEVGLRLGGTPLAGPPVDTPTRWRRLLLPLPLGNYRRVGVRVLCRGVLGGDGGPSRLQGRGGRIGPGSDRRRRAPHHFQRSGCFVCRGGGLPS